jgi:hypothetical protein
LGEPDATDRCMAELEMLLRAALARIAELEAEVANLKRQVGQGQTSADVLGNALELTATAPASTLCDGGSLPLRPTRSRRAGT